MLSAGQQQVMDWFSNQSNAFNLKRSDDGSQLWVRCYRAVADSPVAIMCLANPNTPQAEPRITIFVNLPPGKYAKFETIDLTQESFAALDPQYLIDLSQNVLDKTNEINELEERAKQLRKDLTKYTKKMLGL